MLKFSLILATIGRDAEVEAFLDSLSRQTYRNFELIVVDQNADDRVSVLVDRFADYFPVRRVSSKLGLSVARNRGIALIDGDIVAFPDDDCWYPPELLARAAEYFTRSDVDVIAGQSRDEQNRHSQRAWPSKPQLADKVSIWKLAISYTVFMRAECVEVVGGFDETLGVGAATAWQSGEETDYLIRAIDRGYAVRYLPGLKVFHPEKTGVFDARTIERAKSYGAGLGRVLKKHHYPLWFVAYMLLRPLGGALFALLTLRVNKALYHFGVLQGRVKGWGAA
ncbi:MAG TPA: glycosyltransferase family 2 protein [Spongiibacteraceae bacterium]|nr:glycosyl transferase [Spongiibacteraceae bacterium]HCS26294.1 glycosyltransferase family 2 protein [Spongiibacteraceae bacterium]|tara:strand:- start:308 stop:1147 length:840 start_codon:yes stop_codon:yes gene_type:complete